MNEQGIYSLQDRSGDTVVMGEPDCQLPDGTMGYAIADSVWRDAAPALATILRGLMEREHIVPVGRIADSVDGGITLYRRVPHADVETVTADWGLVEMVAT